MRLINADCLNFEGQHYNRSQMQAILDFIDVQPTAYDIDKVVEELKEWAFNADANIGDGTMMNHNLIASENAIEIVKQGGVSDDVCEWTKYDYKTIRSPHERDWSIPSMKDFKYCPYCGNKIKVVE